MALTKISKLTLTDGQFLKLTLLSPNTAYYSDIQDHAERYIDKLGDNIKPAFGLDQRWNLKNGSHIELHVSQSQDPKYGTKYNITELGFYDEHGNRLWNFSGGNDFSKFLSFGLLVDEENETAAISIIKDIFWDDDLGFYAAQGVYFNHQLYVAIYGSTSDETDPYDGKDGEEGDGGDGTDNNESDPIGIPDLPDIGAVDTGFVTLYNPSLVQLRLLASYMWTENIIEILKKMVGNPMDLIIGLSMYPFAIPNGGTKEVKVGFVSTGVSMTVAAQQFIEIDCGSLTIPEYWGAYLDYSPYTKLELFLPMIGVQSVSADEVIGKQVKIVYHIDILSGSCVCYVKCGNSVLYEFNGSCATQIPINGSDWNNAISSAVTAAATVATAVATGGAALAGESAGTVAANATLSRSIVTASAAAAGAVMSAKPNITRSGSLSGAAGLLGNRKPYFIMTRPRQCVPSGQNKFEGYPSYKTKKLGDCSGFTMVESIHLENISATDAEKTEIVQKLMEGVII